MLREVRSIVVLLVFALLVPAGLSAAGTTLSGVLEAQGQVRIDGDTTTLLPDGAVHLRAPDLTGDPWTLTGATIEVTQQYQEGIRTQTGPYDLTRQYTDMGNDTRVFRDATVAFGMDQLHPEFVALVDGGSQAHAVGKDTVSIETVRDMYVTRVEFSDRSMSLDPTSQGEAPGFWYHVDGPWLELNELDGATVTGEFTLFVNNVTFDIQGEADSWSTWTGYREDHPDRPVSRFETRVTTLRVKGGELLSTHEDQLRLYGRVAEANVSGTITSEEVAGELAAPDKRFHFQRANLRMDGSGTLDLRAGPMGAQAGGQLAAPTSAPIEIETSGEYDIAPTSGVATTTIDGTSPMDASWAWLASLGALALLVLIGSAVVAARAGLVPKLGELRAAVRERRVNAWMRAGDRLTGARDYEGALGYYRKITETYPTVTEAWYSKAVVLAELDRHEEAADAYAVANEQVGGDDPELIDLEAVQAFKTGDVDRAKDLWEMLSVIDPLRLRERLQAPELAELRQEGWARELVGPAESEGVVSYV